MLCTPGTKKTPDGREHFPVVIAKMSRMHAEKAALGPS
jgi:hypothetical protein